MIARRAKHPVSENFGKECSCSLCKNGPPNLSNRLKVVLSSSCVSEHFRWIDFWLGMYTPPTFKWKFPFPGVCFPNLPIIYLLYISGIEISSQWHQHHFYQTSVNGTLLDKNILHLCMTYIYTYPHTHILLFYNDCYKKFHQDTQVRYHIWKGFPSWFWILPF